MALYMGICGAAAAATLGLPASPRWLRSRQAGQAADPVKRTFLSAVPLSRSLGVFVTWTILLNLLSPWATVGFRRTVLISCALLMAACAICFAAASRHFGLSSRGAYSTPAPRSISKPSTSIWPRCSRHGSIERLGCESTDERSRPARLVAHLALPGCRVDVRSAGRNAILSVVLLSLAPSSYRLGLV